MAAGCQSARTYSRYVVSYAQHASESHLIPQPRSHPRGDDVLYFAYGANMSRSTLQRRSVSVVSSTAAQICDLGLALSFSHRAGFATLAHAQISFPNTEKKSMDAAREHSQTGAPQRCSSELYYPQPFGVLYRLRPEELQKISRFEVGYRQIQVRARPCGDEGPDFDGGLGSDGSIRSDRSTQQHECR